MVRFARADGSKGSNKRVLEEPTPWTEMVPQSNQVFDNTDEDRPKKKKAADEKTEGVDGVSKVKKVKKAKKKLQKKENLTNNEEPPEGQQEKESEVGHEEYDVKKKKKKKKNKEHVPQKPVQEFVVNNKGQRIKVFKDGTERPWLDLPYEEGDRMTRYENMWVKCDMVAKLDQLKESLKEQELDQKEVSV